MVVNCKELSENIRKDIKKRIDNLKNRNINVCLAVILVGDDPASKIYVRNKKRACEQLGIISKEYVLDKSSSKEEILSLIDTLNKDNSVSGILVQLPLPSNIDKVEVMSAIDPKKDVDAFNPINIGKMMLGVGDVFPCTPSGIMEIINFCGIDLNGKCCTVIGRSDIVGKPVAHLFTAKNATVTLCHSRTKDLKKHCQNADVLISAVGKPKFITSDMVKKDSVVIDVGINRDEFGKVCGDVDFESVKDIVKYITPVPGGVGPMTITMLMKNTVDLAEIQNE